MWNRRNFRVVYAWRASLAGALTAALLGISAVASPAGAAPRLDSSGTTASTTVLATPVVSNPSGPGATPVAGDTATFSVTVTDGSGSAVTNPTGVVTIYLGSDTTGGFVCQTLSLAPVSGSSPLASSGTCQAPIPDAGTNDFVASYPGDNTFASSLSSVESLTGVDSATSTSVSVAGGTTGLTVGDVISVTANVVATSPGASAAPTGTVAFLDGGSPIHGCSAIALTQGASASSPSVSGACKFTLTAADNSISASYSGDSSDGPAAVTRPTGVGAAYAPSSITWSAVKPTPVAGDTIKVDASMTGVAGVAPFDAIDVEVAVGTKAAVQLVDCADQPFLGSETVSCTYPVTSAEQLTFSASYDGDNGYSPEQWTNTLAVQPTPATPVVTVTTADPAPAVGLADTVTATVTGNPVVGAPTGAITVTVAVGSGSPTDLTCKAATPGTDTESVTCPYTYLNDDPVTFAATVAADTNYVTADANIQRSVRALVPTVIVAVQGGDSVGAPITVTATVTGNSSVSSLLNGPITVIADNSITIPGCVPTQLSAWKEQSQCKYTYSSAAPVTFTATVAASGVYNGAAANPVIEHVGLGTPKTLLTSTTTKPTIGKLLNLTATVQGPAHAAAPVGLVQFFASSGPGKGYSAITSCAAGGKVGLNTADQAVCNVSPFTTTERFEAKYLGDNENYKRSTSDLLKPVIHKASVYLYASKRPSSTSPVPGSVVTIDVTLTGNLPAGSPAGSVTLHGPRGSKCVGSCRATVKRQAGAKAKAAILVKLPRSGLVTMTVTYAGSSKYLTTSGQVSLNVSKGRAITRDTRTVAGARSTAARTTGATAAAPARSAARLDRLNSSRRRSSRSIDRTSLS
jgi:hypothetical protein